MTPRAATIGLDARTVVAAKRRGTGKNLIDLYGRLARLAPEWRFRLYYQPRADAAPPTELALANVAFVPLAMRGDRWALWEELRLPWQAWRDRLDLLHCPAQTAPRWKPVPTVVTIHDLIPIRFAEGWPAREVARLRRNMARSLRDAAAVVTVSEHSRRDLLEEFPEAAAQRIERIYWAPESASRPSSDARAFARLAERYGVGRGRFLFALGAEAPRKNTAGLLEAFALAAREPGFDLELVVGGLQPGALERCRRLVEDWPSRDRVRLFGYLPDEDLPALYNAARAFVFPSHYEGFGLPLLDAMACGCPVLASRRSAIPEIGADACLYFEPAQPERMAQAMLEIARDGALRERLRQAGLARVAQFDWQRTARQLHALYCSLMEGPSARDAARRDDPAPASKRDLSHAR